MQVFFSNFFFYLQKRDKKFSITGRAIYDIQDIVVCDFWKSTLCVFFSQKFGMESALYKGINAEVSTNKMIDDKGYAQ